MRGAIVICILASAAFGQTFEVASIRSVPNTGYPGLGVSRGGPGTADPGQLNFEHATLKLFIMKAYGIEDYQIDGPSWIEADRYDIAAKLPEETTKEQANVMLRNLLTERFKLALHRETREFKAYVLTIAKGGPKFKESKFVPGSPVLSGADALNRVTIDKDGLPWLPAGSPNKMLGSGTISARQQPLSVLTSFLQRRIHLASGDKEPVIDQTGLTSTYDFSLRFTPPIELATANPANSPSDPAPDVFTAVQQYLGLKIEEKKVPLDVLVIDRAERTPTEN